MQSKDLELQVEPIEFIAVYNKSAKGVEVLMKWISLPDFEATLGSFNTIIN